MRLTTHGAAGFGRIFATLFRLATIVILAIGFGLADRWVTGAVHAGFLLLLEAIRHHRRFFAETKRLVGNFALFITVMFVTFAGLVSMETPFLVSALLLALAGWNMDGIYWRFRDMSRTSTITTIIRRQLIGLLLLCGLLPLALFITSRLTLDLNTWINIGISMLTVISFSLLIHHMIRQFRPNPSSTQPTLPNESLEQST